MNRWEVIASVGCLITAADIYNSCGGCSPSKQRKTLKNFYLVGGQKLQVEISKNNKQNEIVGRGKNGTTERLGVHDQTVVGFGRDSRSLPEFPYRSTGGIFLRPNIRHCNQPRVPQAQNKRRHPHGTFHRSSWMQS
ncbi:hypothetical protein DAPPUDRAFT_257328 [Daphnia pulex]|uniref:Uncharacterized protein n=1 Tax=Daphnia pulex TaxID=6669 RepID=E9HDD0_DAPPU|nr:hypothetical protein DAPPUDRAFT_257328 [Daphnia pulex]|eukprot:EFX70266.1 hypothetical protein DAPPUDRAFT_257328 [Daphnia pulex]